MKPATLQRHATNGSQIEQTSRELSLEKQAQADLSNFPYRRSAYVA